MTWEYEDKQIQVLWTLLIAALRRCSFKQDCYNLGLILEKCEKKSMLIM